MVEETTETTILGESVGAAVISDPDNQPDQGVEKPDKAEHPWLAQYVGEDKKYKNADEVAKAYSHMEQFVEVLKTEKAQVEAKLAEALGKTNTVEEIVRALREDKGNGKQKEIPDDMASLVEHMVTETISKREREAKEKERERQVWTTLDEAFGDREASRKAMQMYVGGDADKAEVVNRLGLTDPSALVAMLKATVDAPQPEKVPVIGTEGTSGVNPTNADTGRMTWAKAKQIRKENPKLYNSRDFQVMLHKAASQNENFFNN